MTPRKRVERFSWWERFKNNQSIFLTWRSIKSVSEVASSEKIKVETMKGVSRFLILSFLPVLWCFPYHENHEGLDNVNFIGKGTNEIATSLLQVTSKDYIYFQVLSVNISVAVCKLIYVYHCRPSSRRKTTWPTLRLGTRQF